MLDGQTRKPSFYPPPRPRVPPRGPAPRLVSLESKGHMWGGGGGEVKEETAFGSGLWLFVAL